MASSSSPEGLLLGSNPRKPTHRVGKLIGTGACSTVYEIEALDGSKTVENFAVKIAPLPQPRTGSWKKKKPTDVERNANLLYNEHIMYTAQLNSLRGSYIPKLPTASKEGPPQYGEVDGFRFLCMEKMDSPLFDVVTRLLAGKRTRQGKIPFGPVAARLLDCLEALHQTGFLFVDVKPENFMLAKDRGKTIASKIRMIDFGLIQNVKSIKGHRPNEGTSSLVGTPLYSSLNVHDKQTHSRRDDLEGLGYIVGELLMKLVAAANGQDDRDVKLPWSHGTSDEDIAALKQKEMTSTRSNFFCQVGAFGNDDCEQGLRQYFQTVRAMTYSANPDYEVLRSILLGLDVSKPATAGSKKKPGSAHKQMTTATSRSTPVRKSARNKRASPESDDEDVYAKEPAAAAAIAKEKKPAARRQTATAAAAAASKASSTTTMRTTRNARSKRASPKSDDIIDVDAPSDEDVPAASKIRRVIAIDDDDFFDAKEVATAASVDDDYATARDEEMPEPMDWEPTIEEASPPARDENQAPPLGLKVKFVEGPHKGESFLLIKDKESETMFLGRNPTAKKGGGVYCLSNDDQVDNIHVKLVLKARKRLQMVVVTDLKSSTGTQVNGSDLTARKEQTVFINDNIQIGHSTMKILEISQQDMATPKKPAAVSAAASASAKRPAVVQTSNDKDLVSPLQEEPTRSKQKRVPRLRVTFIEGPYKNESFVLIKDERMVLGSNPVAKRPDKTLRLSDSSVDANHARLTLNYARGLCTVTVKDLKSSGTFVNLEQIASGKERKAFINDTIQIGDSVMKIRPL